MRGRRRRQLRASRWTTPPRSKATVSAFANDGGTPLRIRRTLVRPIEFWKLDTGHRLCHGRLMGLVAAFIRNPLHNARCIIDVSDNAFVCVAYIDRLAGRMLRRHHASVTGSSVISCAGAGRRIRRTPGMGSLASGAKMFLILQGLRESPPQIARAFAPRPALS